MPQALESFLYTDEDGNLLSAPELRNPFNTKTQTVVVTLVNKINTTCPATYELEFVVNPLPEFTVDDTTIVCLNLPPIPIGVVSADVGGGGFGILGADKRHARQALVATDALLTTDSWIDRGVD